MSGQVRSGQVKSYLNDTIAIISFVALNTNDTGKANQIVSDPLSPSVETQQSVSISREMSKLTRCSQILWFKQKIHTCLIAVIMKSSNLFIDLIIVRNLRQARSSVNWGHQWVFFLFYGISGIAEPIGDFFSLHFQTHSRAKCRPSTTAMLIRPSAMWPAPTLSTSSWASASHGAWPPSTTPPTVTSSTSTRAHWRCPSLSSASWPSSPSSCLSSGGGPASAASWEVPIVRKWSPVPSWSSSGSSTSSYPPWFLTATSMGSRAGLGVHGALLFSLCLPFLSYLADSSPPPSSPFQWTCWGFVCVAVLKPSSTGGSMLWMRSCCCGGFPGTCWGLASDTPHTWGSSCWTWLLFCLLPWNFELRVCCFPRSLPSHVEVQWLLLPRAWPRRVVRTSPSQHQLKGKIALNVVVHAVLDRMFIPVVPLSSAREHIMHVDTGGGKLGLEPVDGSSQGCHSLPGVADSWNWGDEARKKCVHWGLRMHLSFSGILGTFHVKSSVIVWPWIPQNLGWALETRDNSLMR